MINLSHQYYYVNSMSRKLSTGKVSADVLRRLVFPYTGIKSDRVIKGPSIGEDAAVLDMGEKAFIVKANPITGAESRIGWLAVHINANDVATCGAKPEWFVATVLLPDGADESLLETIMIEINDACCQLGISLIGGHTESVPGLKRPIISGCMMGEVEKEKCVTTGGAQVGDHIILTKGAGIEGTGILASDLVEVLREKVNEKTLKDAVKMLEQVSVVKEALKAHEVGGVHSIHTPTEGGLLNGLWEMAESSGLGMNIYKEKIPVAPETREISDVLGIDPLKLLCSGGLILVSDPKQSDIIIAELGKIGVISKVIGEMVPEGRFLYDQGEKILINPILQDEVYRILEKYS